MSTKTPKTDAIEKRYAMGMSGTEYVSADFARTLERECEKLKEELDTTKNARAWKFIVQLTEQSASATAMSIDQLAEAIRREITDHIPMDSREFALIDELVNRMDGKTAGFFVPVEDR